MCEVKDWNKYLKKISIDAKFVRLGDEGPTWGPYSSNPYGDNRYGTTGVYIASGEQTARREVGEDRLAGKKLYRMNEIEYTVFDAVEYGADHPEERENLIAPKESGGYAYCQGFKSDLIEKSGATVSGLMYESTKNPGGLNLHLWNPNDPTAVPAEFFGEGEDIATDSSYEEESSEEGEPEQRG